MSPPLLQECSTSLRAKLNGRPRVVGGLRSGPAPAILGFLLVQSPKALRVNRD